LSKSFERGNIKGYQVSSRIEEDHLLTVEDVADELGFREITIRRWLAAGQLPGYKVGRAWRVDPRELDTWKRAARARSA
jgi:excisionase family DNA binding protein